MSLSSPEAPSIHVKKLTYKFPDGSAGLDNISIDLPPGSRTLLIGGWSLSSVVIVITPLPANGAGKTTLLRLLSGKRLAPTETILIGSVDPFKHGLEGVTYLGMEWVLNPIVRNDISVTELLSSVGGDVYPDRRGQLVRILDIDTDWHMHAVSDGERRRVQLAMGLLRPWSILFLDEVTVDLDVLARARFLEFLKTETQERGCTIVYATHILEHAKEWASHLVRVSLGRVKSYGTTEEMLAGRPLLPAVIEWLEEDLEERGPRGKMKSEHATYKDLEKIE